MIWILGITGILLTLLGVWGGPVKARKRRESDTLARRQPTATEAWDILAAPMENELIKLPEHKPWYMPGGDRRFMRGIFVGLGAGLMVASVAVSTMPRTVTPPATAATDPSTGVDTAKNAPTPPAPATQQPVAQQPEIQQPATQQPPVQQPAAEPPKPANVTFVVEPGDLATTIAANLKAQGLIADEDAFLVRVKELGADTLLQSGTFVVPTGADLDQVIRALTS